MPLSCATVHTYTQDRHHGWLVLAVVAWLSIVAYACTVITMPFPAVYWRYWVYYMVIGDIVFFNIELLFFFFAYMSIWWSGGKWYNLFHLIFSGLTFFVILACQCMNVMAIALYSDRPGYDSGYALCPACPSCLNITLSSVPVVHARSIRAWILLGIGLFDLIIAAFFVVAAWMFYGKAKNVDEQSVMEVSSESVRRAKSSRRFRGADVAEEEEEPPRQRPTHIASRYGRTYHSSDKKKHA